ncbi:unnamed protein product [Lactuca virosa]|uniref:RRM domain-containing protein n=1 Tax=Lactuca virosa TaxID=75947 RepID=A0AAU9M2L9_9ASTR|nr:unnamed protein product [Lactuca virosa]
MVGNEQGSRSRYAPSNNRLVDNLSFSFYVTNFPPNADVKSLWDVCAKIGTVADVYMARKLSKLGKRFAFVRFIRASDDQLLERRLWEIWMGSYHLFASISRFNRAVNGGANSQGQVNRSVSQGLGNRFKTDEQMGRSQVYVHVQTGSYASAVKGDTGINVKKKLDSGVCFLQGTELDNPLSMRSSIFGKLRDIRLIPKLCILLKEEGFPEIVIKYVASDWVFISFLSENTCTRFKKCEGLSLIFQFLDRLLMASMLKSVIFG